MQIPALANMQPGTLVPPWFTVADPTLHAVILSSWMWGFTMCLIVFAFSKGFGQTYRCLRRSHRPNAYIVWVWLVWMAGIVEAAVSFAYTMNWIPPSLWFNLGVRKFIMDTGLKSAVEAMSLTRSMAVVLWTTQVQGLTQIMANRVSLIMYDQEKARRLKLGVALIIGIINLSVFIIWIPARLQISKVWIRTNEIWDRCEKVIFLFVDAALNLTFMQLVKSKLIASGLYKYRQVYRFNGLLVCISLSLDVSFYVRPGASAETCC